MADLSQLAGGPPSRTTRPPVARGYVTRAPASLTAPLSVALVNFSSDYTFEVPASNWMARGETMPAVGDRCVVVFDDDGDAWVPAWSGIANPAGALNASDFQGAGVNDTTALLRAADAASLQTRSLFIPRRAAEWVLTAAIDTITAGIEVFGDWTVLRQSTWHQAIFDLGTQGNVDIHHFVLRCTETRANGAAAFRGDDADRFGAGVWGAGSQCSARHLRIDGLDTGVHFTNWTTGTTHAGTPTDNVVDDIRVVNVDFGVLCVAQAGLRITNIAGSYVRSTGSGDPAHLVYITYYGTDLPQDLVAGRWRAIDSPADPAFQIKKMRGGTVAGMVARNCGGLLNYDDCQDLAIAQLVGINDQKADENGSLFAVTNTSQRVHISNLIIRKAVAGRAIRWVGTDCVIDTATVEVSRPSSVGNEDIQIGGTRSGINRLKHSNIGSITIGGEGVLVNSTAVDCFLRDPEIRGATTQPGTRNCVKIAAGATGTYVEYSPAMLVPAATFNQVSDAGTASRLVTKGT